MTIPIRHIPYGKIARFYPLALVVAVIALVWMSQRHHRTMERYAHLQQTLAGYFHSARNEAQEAFAAGDFQRTAALLDPSTSDSKPDAAALLLRARSLECLGYFPEAAGVYVQLEAMPGRHLAILRGKAFCQRMASERMPSRIPSREVLYRLHEELMRRGDPASARFVARKLLPDAQPLNDSLLALLRGLDVYSQLAPSAEQGLVDITITHWRPEMLELLREVKIDRLRLAQCNLQSVHDLAGLDVRSLDLTDDRVSDITALRSMPLRQLNLDHTTVADVRPLAGLPLRELNLAHTMVSSVQALALCPLQKLNLSRTAVKSVESLRGMELRELDLSHTNVSDLAPLSGMPLERLVLDRTSVHDLRALAGAQLKSLSLVDTAVKDLNGLADMPLTELDLRGCELLTDIGALARCPNLEHVYLPRHLKAPTDHWQLPRLRFIEYERQGASAIAKK